MRSSFEFYIVLIVTTIELVVTTIELVRDSKPERTSLLADTPSFDDNQGSMAV